MKPVHGSCCSLYRAMVEFRRNPVGGRGCWNKRLFPAGQSGAQTFRLIVSCHCQHKTKACDLSMCSVTALKTDDKPQGSPATLFEGSTDGLGWGLGILPEAVGVGWKGGVVRRQESSVREREVSLSWMWGGEHQLTGLWIQAPKEPSGLRACFFVKVVAKVKQIPPGLPRSGCWGQEVYTLPS